MMGQSLNKRILLVRKERANKAKGVLLSKLETVKEILVNKYNVKKIFLVGSLLNDKRLHSLSDIDLIVEGLGSNYLNAGGYLIDHVGECVDLKPFEMLDKDFRENIIRTGKIIYCRDQSLGHFTS